MVQGRAPQPAQEQYYLLELLVDAGGATLQEDGFTVPSTTIARLGDDEAAVLRLPMRFDGVLDARVSRWTSSPDFRIDLDLRVGPHPASAERRGPFLRLGTQLYRLSLPLLRMLQALEAHHALPPEARGETHNVRLVAQLQAAQRQAAAAEDPAERDESLRLSLGGLDRFTTVSPPKVGLFVEPQNDGSLAVQPDLGHGVPADLVAARWHQIDEIHPTQRVGERDLITSPGARTAHDGAVIRAGQQLVVLGAEQLAAVHEVRSRPHIPAEDVERFLQAPGSYYDPERVDVDLTFGIRVAGLGVIAPMTFADASSSGIEWFAQREGVAAPAVLVGAALTLEEHERIQADVTTAWAGGASVVPVGDQLVDVSDKHLVQEALAASRRRLAARAAAEDASAEACKRLDPAERLDQAERRVTVGMHILDTDDVSHRLRSLASGASPVRPVDYGRLVRSAFPHQREGVEWLVGLMHCALAGDRAATGHVQGALLADDMGLGKTFMTLVALAEAHRAQTETGDGPLPTLAVMPLALLETWREEIRKTFGNEQGPFSDVIVLQGLGVTAYRQSGAGPETTARASDLDERGMVRSDRIHAALRVGPDGGETRLDRPGVLVLTTYQTLQRYQVSLGLVDWGVVVFDEAQYLKNPEILASRAAKALKARFKLLATGTPVENSLRDFWALMDTAQPGLLGTWAQFRATWADPMAAATGQVHERLGRALRSAVGDFMLRRIKEDHLPELPKKHVHVHRQAMPAGQAAAYDSVLTAHARRSGSRGAALKTLHELAAVSLHPGLQAGRLEGDQAAVEESARTLVTVRLVLDEIRTKDEKVIVFTKTRTMQVNLASWLSQRYGLRVDIVNGDTAATGVGDTRMAKVRAFQAREGFNVIIMSPLAVGVGLTVVGANHAIHLERHWNPAKEAQATDRIYRIGQQREVHVHVPLAVHPTVDSFDVNLDRLLQSKVALRDAVVVPGEVSHDEMERALRLA